MIRLFLISLLNRWFEYLAASAVVALAVAALIVQGSLASSAEKQVHDLAHDLGNNMLVVPAGMDLAGFYSLDYGDETLPDSYPGKLMQSRLAPHMRGIQPALYGNLEVVGVPLVLVGQPQMFQGFPQQAAGDAPPAAVGDAAARRLGLQENDTFQVRGRDLTVVQIATSLPDGLDMAVFVDLDVAQQILGKPGEINAMYMGGCWCSIDVPALAADVEQELPNTRAITVAGVIQSQQGTISTVKRYSKVLFGVAILLIAGITVMLTTAQVRRQKREIGLLLAIGASAWKITLFFVAMAAVIVGVGGLGGVLLGDPLTRLAADRFMGSPLPASPDAFLPVLVPTLLVSLLVALVPAFRASRLDPTTTLREV